MKRMWDRPANEHSHQLPAGMTLREWAQAEHDRGRSTADIDRQLEYRYGSTSRRIKVKRWPTPQGKPMEFPSTEYAKPMSDRERQRVAAAYGFRSWDDYQTVKAAGLTVAELRELAERRDW